MQLDPDLKAIERYCERWGIRELSVFGSVLRDDFRDDSDVDVLISFREDEDWDYWNWPEMMDGLEAIFGRKIDLVVKGSIENPYRRHHILETHRVLHAA
jgi:predicted nucleotidyltransferase